MSNTLKENNTPPYFPLDPHCTGEPNCPIHASDEQPNQELREQLKNTKTFNYNVYGGQSAFFDSLSFEAALNEIVALVEQREQQLLTIIEHEIDSKSYTKEVQEYHLRLRTALKADGLSSEHQTSQ